MTDAENTTLTPQEVADTLRIAKTTVYDLIKRGDLRAYRAGKKYRIDRADIQAYMGRGQTANPTGSAIAAPELARPHEAPSPVEQFPSQNGFVLCGQDIILDLLAQRLETHPDGGQVYRSYLGSYNGLYALYQGRVNVASAHLWDGSTDSYNLPFIPYILPGIAATVVHLACRTVGFYVQSGNPFSLRGWEDLRRPELSIVNREKGSGMRVLLDERLRLMKINPESIPGYEREHPNHLAAASTVARNGGHYALGNEKTARQVNGIEFIPLQQERYELVFPTGKLKQPIYRALLQIVQSAWFRDELRGLGGYDVSESGKIILG